MPQHQFDYKRAFSRNIGWVTRDELDLLRTKRVAIAGMGGVGGIHLITLSRLGIGKFNIADFDTFEVENFNRQAGASMDTVGKEKAAVMAAQAKAINPEMDLQIFNGVEAKNIDAFLEGVDLYVDGLDAFAFEARMLVFAACHKKGIPATTVAPVGMGAALLNFLPGQMSYEQYFGLEGKSHDERFLRFLLGLTPTGIHRQYLVDPTTFNLETRSAPSTAMGCQLSAGVAATEALKILLKRGKVTCAPHSVHFDSYLNTIKHRTIYGGCRNPIFRLKLHLAKKMFIKIKK